MKGATTTSKQSALAPKVAESSNTHIQQHTKIPSSVLRLSSSMSYVKQTKSVCPLIQTQMNKNIVRFYVCVLYLSGAAQQHSQPATAAAPFITHLLNLVLSCHQPQLPVPSWFHFTPRLSPLHSCLLPDWPVQYVATGSNGCAGIQSDWKTFPLSCRNWCKHLAHVLMPSLPSHSPSFCRLPLTQPLVLAMSSLFLITGWFFVFLSNSHSHLHQLVMQVKMLSGFESYQV